MHQAARVCVCVAGISMADRVRSPLAPPFPRRPSDVGRPHLSFPGRSKRPWPLRMDTSSTNPPSIRGTPVRRTGDRWSRVSGPGASSSASPLQPGIPTTCLGRGCHTAAGLNGTRRHVLLVAGHERGRRACVRVVHLWRWNLRGQSTASSACGLKFQAHLGWVFVCTRAS